VNHTGGLELRMLDAELTREAEAKAYRNSDSEMTAQQTGKLTSSR